MEWLELLKELLDGKREVCVRIRCEPRGLRIGVDLGQSEEGIGSQDGRGDLAHPMGELEKGSAESPGEEGSFPVPLAQVPGNSTEGSKPVQGGANPPDMKGGVWRLEKLGVVASTKKKLVLWAERITLPKRPLSNRGGKALTERRRSERPWRCSGRAWSRSVPG